MATQSGISRRKHKDKKIIIYQVISEQDSDGYNTSVYRPIHPGKLWAYVRQLSATEYFAAAALQVTEEMLFSVNWRADLIAENVREYYILYKGVWYDIQRIDVFEGYKSDIQLYTKVTRAPAANEIKPYE